jgi:hypothetical protein
VFRKPSFLACLLFLLTADVSRAQAVARPDSAVSAASTRSGSWSATNGRGLALSGAWTAVPDTTKGTVTGTWTLVDAQGRALAGGAWSAAKSVTRWNGAWRAVIAGKDGEYSGQWTSSVDLEPNARFVDLFEKAIQAMVSGGWYMGSKSGAWSIRASK